MIWFRVSVNDLEVARVRLLHPGKYVAQGHSGEAIAHHEILEALHSQVESIRGALRYVYLPGNNEMRRLFSSDVGYF